MNDLEHAVETLNEAYETRGRYQLVRTASDLDPCYAIQKCVGMRLEKDSPWLTAPEMSVWIRAQLAAIATMKRRALRQQVVGLERDLKHSIKTVDTIDKCLALLPGGKLGGKS